MQQPRPADRVWIVETPNGDGTYRVWLCEDEPEAKALAHRRKAHLELPELQARARLVDGRDYLAWYRGRRHRP